MVGASTILWNGGDMAPLANVIAPGLLIQTKRTPTPRRATTKPRSSRHGARNREMSTITMPTTTLQSQAQSSPSPQHSEAFPENLLCVAQPKRDQCQYATIGKGGKEEIITGLNQPPCPLPSWNTTSSSSSGRTNPITTNNTMTFLLSITATVLDLSFLANERAMS